MGCWLGADTGHAAANPGIAAGLQRPARHAAPAPLPLLRCRAGIEGAALVDGRAKSLVAYHEAGHALCGTLQPGHDPVAKVSLVPRGQVSRAGRAGRAGPGRAGPGRRRACASPAPPLPPSLPRLPPACAAEVRALRPPARPPPQARGLTWFQPGEDPALVSRSQMFARMVGALGGRAAEEVVFGAHEVTSGGSPAGALRAACCTARAEPLRAAERPGPEALTPHGPAAAARRAAGASGDLQQVAALARQMVLQYGMSDIGPWALQQQQGGMSDALRGRVDAAVRAMSAEAYAAALAHVRAHREALDCAAQALLEREALSGEEFRALLAQFVALPAEQAQAGGRRGAARAAAAERTEL